MMQSKSSALQYEYRASTQQQLAVILLYIYVPLKMLRKRWMFNKKFEEVCTLMFFLPRARLDLPCSNLL